MRLIEKISNNTRSVSLVKIDEGYEVLNKKGVDYDVARFETLIEALNHFNMLAELFETSAPGLQTIN